MMKNLQAVLLLSGLVLLPGCTGAQPFNYHPSTEIPQGPGLFSGDSGALGTPSPGSMRTDADRGS